MPAARETAPQAGRVQAEGLAHVAERERRLDVVGDDPVVYTVTHDLKSPLSAILLIADLLLEREGAALGAESRDDLERIVRLAGGTEDMMSSRPTAVRCRSSPSRGPAAGSSSGSRRRATDDTRRDPALRLLERYPWPGNVRELENEIHRLVACAEPGEQITADLLARWIVEGVPSAAADGMRPLKEIVREVELATIRTRLRAHGYHRTATARSLGITRESLWAKLRQLGFALPRRRAGDE